MAERRDVDVDVDVNVRRRMYELGEPGKRGWRSLTSLLRD